MDSNIISSLGETEAYILKDIPGPWLESRREWLQQNWPRRLNFVSETATALCQMTSVLRKSSYQKLYALRYKRKKIR